MLGQNIGRVGLPDMSSGGRPSLTLDFVGIPVLNERITFSRTSGATWFSPDGVLKGVDFSTSSVAIGTGSKTFTLTADAGANRYWAVGDLVRVSQQSNSANFMDGTVTSYTASTQTLVVNVTATGGSGTIASWRVSNWMPRFDYDPATLLARGLLIEEARVNSVTQSTAMDVNRLAAVAGGSGTFTNGETLNFSGGGSGVYVGYSSSASILALRNATGALSGTVTGASSGATRTVTTVTESWNAVVGITRSPAAGTAPDGTVTAVKIEETATNSEHINRQVVTGLVSGNVYTVSFFAKAAERTCGRIRILDAVVGTAGYVVNFDLVAGTTTTAVIGAGTVTSSFCTPVGNGWFRVGVTGSLNQTSALFDIYTMTSIGGAATYLGTAGFGYLMWGAQFETTSAAGAATFATSFIPTTTTALTRSADVASVNTLSPWYNSAAGTLYAEAQIAAGIGAAPAVMAGIDDTTINNRIQLRRQSPGTVGDGRFVSSGGNWTGTVTSGTLTGVNKQAVAYAASDQAGAVNGTLMTGIVSVATLPTITRLALGDGQGSTPLNGWLRRVVFYPRRLSNAELQAITV